ncbi:MAG: type III-B CRISPR module RAMP protein Cmr6 [Verrucomicrobiota bacterium]
MAILLPKDTKEALGADAKGCDSRSLLFDRFADPGAKEEPRKAWFKRITDLKPHPVKYVSWSCWLGDGGLGLSPNAILLAQLQSRLMVNMAGGVMENAGLCLDRFGVPYIPGSAVKGCARRMAVHNLQELREIKESADKLSHLLTDLALVFGWGEQEWSFEKKEGRFISDFACAVGPDCWGQVSAQTRAQLPRTSHFAGTVSFLPAFPHHLPARDLDLDVITCHHPDYYSRRTDARGSQVMPQALDTEDPNPVIFPAVAAGAVFAFAALPLRGVRDSLSQSGRKLHEVARGWLIQGLETFGIGAKTAAGYGWFAEVDGTGGLPGASPQQASFSGSPGAAPATPLATEHLIVAQWRGKTQPANFRAFRPALAALKDDAELKRVFDAIMPAAELARLKRANPYWQSFGAHPEGAAILKRLKLELR